jgi:hypothetical protein
MGKRAPMLHCMCTYIKASDHTAVHNLVHNSAVKLVNAVKISERHMRTVAAPLEALRYQ